MAACLDILGNSEAPAEARLRFLLSQLAFWLLAAPDGHAKNFSLFINPGGTYIPTPLYDILSAWPIIGKKARQMPYQKAGMAMAVRSANAHTRFGEIEARHWKDLALRTGGPAAWDVLVDMVQCVDAALDRVQGSGFPADFPELVWDAISAGMKKHAARFLRAA
jgi:serine/threonine-protein kinase HipA